MAEPTTGPDPDPSDTDAPGQRPAAPTSALAGIRDRRQKVVAELFTDLEVPRYDPPIYVRFGPIPDTRIEALNKQTAKSKDPAKNVVANAVALAEVCLGVFEVIDGEKVSVDPENRSSDPGDWPRFNDHLAALLGLEGATKAADVVRGLYATDGDLLSTSGRVTEWSGYSLDGVDELEGN